MESYHATMYCKVAQNLDFLSFTKTFQLGTEVETQELTRIDHCRQLIIFTFACDNAVLTFTLTSFEREPLNETSADKSASKNKGSQTHWQLKTKEKH